MNFKSKFFPALFAFFIMVAMVGISVMLGDSEIIFPEAAALCAGGLLAPKMVWSVSKPRFVIAMAVCSVVGLLLSLSPFPILLKIALGYITAQLCISVLRCGLLPAISACILPVLVNAKSIAYPISVVLIALAVVFFRWVLEKNNIRSSEKFVPNRIVNGKDIIHIVTLLVCILLYSIYPTIAGNILFIAPPLMVMFCEVLSREQKFKCREHLVCLFVILCSTLSVGIIVLSNSFGLSPIISAGIVAVVVIVLMNGFKFYFPPAAALAFLPFILEASILWMYPICIAVTSVVISVSAFAVRKWGEKRVNSRHI